MQYARAVIAAVLATGLIIVVFLQEASEFGRTEMMDDPLDPTFLLLVGAILILTIPDALAYIRKKQEPDDKEDE